MRIRVYNNGRKHFKFQNQNIVPNLIIQHKDKYKIISVPNHYFIINNFSICTENNKLKDIFIYHSWHPNASENPNEEFKISSKPPRKQYFCLPNYLKDQIIDEKNINHFICVIKKLLSTYNYSHSYWVRWEGFNFLEII